MTIQNIPYDFISNIHQYGYLIIFLLVFLQEVGVPNLIPNELVLIFSGYLSYKEVLQLPMVILSAIAGDVLGSGILFSLFFFFGKTIMNKKPKWIPISKRKLNKLSRKLQKKGFVGVIIGRVSPFIRGYVAVLLGLMNYPIKRYAMVLITTAALWACFYVTAGYFMGPYWTMLSGYLSNIQLFMGFIPLTIILVIIIRQGVKYFSARMQPKSLNV